ncbi:hypothetical protein AUC45_10115 [Erythrobacter sp. YT30]|nr:hypothetical protein AUC45_10115 [Erythrobacter sp. YT30]
MKRFVPSSLLGQVMAVLAIGLLAAQVISATLLYQASQQRREATVVNSIAFRLVGDLSRTEAMRLQDEERRRLRDARRAERQARGERIRPPDSPFPNRRQIRTERTSASPISDRETRLSDHEDALQDVLAREGITVRNITVTRRLAADDPFIRNVLENRPRLRQPGWESRRIIVASIEPDDEDGWLTVRLPEPERPDGAPWIILLQTLVTFCVLVLLLYLVLRRITRPLAQLTTRVEDFSRTPDRAVELAESGPSDTRRLIAAHNAMEARIAALLDEKDVMLGAIGHDLKTPLAALRVRIESVPDDTQRERMAETIEDITATLDDILSLARIGRSGAPPEAVELGALAISVTEEFEDLGDPVTIADPPRLVAKVQVTWLKRALRNLIANAVRYGEKAEVSLIEQSGYAVLRVDDQGPGIPEDRIAEMLEPFARGEGSRNRSTGGAGLGLTLARAIAEQHGGRLVLNNLEGDGNRAGLRAELHIPM